MVYCENFLFSTEEERDSFLEDIKEMKDEKKAEEEAEQEAINLAGTYEEENEDGTEVSE